MATRKITEVMTASQYVSIARQCYQARKFADKHGSDFALDAVTRDLTGIDADDLQLAVDSHADLLESLCVEAVDAGEIYDESKAVSKADAP